MNINIVDSTKITNYSITKYFGFVGLLFIILIINCLSQAFVF